MTGTPTRQEPTCGLANKVSGNPLQQQTCDHGQESAAQHNNRPSPLGQVHVMDAPQQVAAEIEGRQLTDGGRPQGSRRHHEMGDSREVIASQTKADRDRTAASDGVAQPWFDCQTHGFTRSRDQPRIPNQSQDTVQR